MSAAPEPGLLRRRWEGSEPVEAHQPGESRELGWSEPDPRQALAERCDRRVDVALDVEVAGHVGAAETELARRGQDPAERVGGPNHQRGRGVGRSDSAAVIGLDGDRQVGTDEPLDGLRDCHPRSQSPHVV